LAGHKHQVSQHHQGLDENVNFQGFLDPDRQKQEREVNNCSIYKEFGFFPNYI
jgi:hypothetical protein